MRHRHPANITRHDQQSALYARVDKVLAGFGSVRFLAWQTVIITVWIALNIAAIVGRWDPYPFILLNLVFSTQAAYAAPLILLSQNRQSEHDRHRAEEDYAHNEATLELLRVVHEHLMGVR